MGLTDYYKEEVEKMTIQEAKDERKKIQDYVDKGNFDTSTEMMFQHFKLTILDEKIGDKNKIVSNSETVTESKPETETNQVTEKKKRKWFICG